MPKGQLGIAICSVDGCDRRCVGWGYCGLHYQRQIKNGTHKPSHRSQARAETIGKDGMRKCWKCGNRKPFTAEFFPRDCRKGEAGLKGTCRDCAKSAVKNATVRRSYGITLDELSELIEKQGCRCAICGEKFATEWHAMGKGSVGKSRRAHVDHDHKSGIVRGVLCHHCNVGIGHFCDSTERLKSAIAYLEAKSANA